MTTTTSFCCLGAGPLLERRRHPLTRRIFKHKNCVNASSTAGDPVAARNCSETLWQQHRHLYFLNLLNPFVQGMIHGNLPPEAFESYSSQDVYYLRVFKTAIAKLRETLIECSTWADKGEATKRKAIDNSESLLQSIDEEIESVHGSFITVDSIASNVGTRASCEATETYTNFLKQIMEQDPKPSHILASIIPCFRLYYELANEMKTHIMDMSGTLDDHPYAAWILHYSSREYLASVTSAEWILNQTLPIDSLTTPTGTFVNYYGLALRYENEFFRAHAMNVPRDEEDAPSYLVVDFDDTCTVHDTLHFIAKAASMNALERTSMNEMEVYKELVSYYLQDRRSALDAFYSENGKMPHNQRLDRLMDDLSRYELESNDRSFKSLIGAGATLETIRAVARDVRFAPNCINTLIQAQKECGMHVVVLSVNWSSELIGYAFENHGMAVKLVSSFSEVEESSTDVIHVLANRMEFEDGVTTGYIERICETVNDKKEIMRGMGPHSRRIYVGDSLTDIGALLLDGVEGILFGQKELVINVLENIEVDMVPLRHYAVHDKESSMERPHVYQTSSWDELYGFLHAVTGDAPMSSEHLFDIPKVLLISGSDSGGGAGMQADIKTCVACHAFPLNTVTAVTSQNSHGVHDIHTVPAKQIRSQIRAVESDIGFSCIKIGMLGSVENVKAVAEEVQHLRQQRSQWTPLVVDPVLISSSGSALATQGLESALKEHIFPISTIITPNIPEASALLGGMTIDSVEAMKTAATVLYAMGPQYVLIKGGHLNDSSRHAVDVLYDGKIITEFSKPLLQCENTHGTGCSLSSAIASYIAAGDSVVEAVEKAKHFVWRAMERSSGLLIGTGRQKAMNITHTVHDWMACYSSDRVPNDIDLTLYAVSSPNTTSADKTDEEILQQVESVIQGGATVIQIRDKVSEGGRLTRIVSKVVKLCRPHGVKVIVNDRVDVCLAADACGVHVGQNDIDARVVRKMVGPDKILGVSCKTVELALKAQRDGADYLGCGAVFDTPTKDSRRIGFDGVRKIKKSVQIPVVAIGGIDASNAAETIQNTGCDGVAVVRAIFDATDIQKSTALLREVVGRSIAEECN